MNPLPPVASFVAAGVFLLCLGTCVVVEAAAASQLASSPLLGGQPQQPPPPMSPQHQRPPPPPPPPPGLGAADWVLFGLVLAATAAAGIFHGCLKLASGSGGGGGGGGGSGGNPAFLLEIRRRGAAADVAFLFVCYNTFLVLIGMHGRGRGEGRRLWNVNALFFPFFGRRHRIFFPRQENRFTAVPASRYFWYACICSVLCA